ncbi:MAG TPA: hypothetical protein VJ385_19430 [Fibrobacteria bacterium]|nr:hypothetical protein [Fibrobacteria bacterium]
MKNPGRFLSIALLLACAQGASAQSVWNTVLWTSGKAANLSSMAWNGSLMVAVGWRSEDTSGLILTSPDGVTWTPHPSGTKSFLYSVAWAEGQFVAVGGPTDSLSGGTAILTSPDGIAWTPRDVGLTNVLFSVTWTGSQWVAVGGVSRNGAGSAVIVTSPDGATWTPRNSGISGADKLLDDVVWTGGKLVAAGYPGLIVTSPDGETWTARESGTVQTLSSLAWTGTQVVAVGDTGTILTSPDGETWTKRTSGTSNYLTSVTWTGSQLVSVGVKGDLLTSRDGTAWSNDNFGTAAAPLKVVWVRGRLITLFVVAHYFLTSPDDPTVRVAPPPRAAGAASFRTAPGRLFVTLPAGSAGLERAAIYTPAGAKVAEIRKGQAEALARSGSREFVLPMGGLPRGLYLFKAEGAAGAVAKPFVLAP